jgi:hypothetical protein
MICASVCLLLLMDLSLFQIRNHTRLCADLGEQVSPCDQGVQSGAGITIVS